MANRYCNLVGTNKIKDEYTKINDGFDAVEQEMDAAMSAAQAAQATADAALPKSGGTIGGPLKVDNYSGKELTVGTWAEISDNGDGNAFFGNNAYTSNSSNYYYSNNHANIGARGIRLGPGGITCFDTGPIATTAGQQFTPTWYDIWHSGRSGPFYKGSGSPEGSVTAPVGAIYQRTDGGASTTLYVKESGTGNTGWKAVQTA